MYASWFRLSVRWSSCGVTAVSARLTATGPRTTHNVVLALATAERLEVRDKELAELVADLPADDRVFRFGFSRLCKSREVGVGRDGALAGNGGDGREVEVPEVLCERDREWSSESERVLVGDQLRVRTGQLCDAPGLAATAGSRVP